jgi:hypothetical protein
VRDDLPKLTNPDRAKATVEEAKAVVAGSIAYYGTYSINEIEKVLTAKVEGSTHANLLGTEQRRIITSLTADELKFTNPRTPAGVDFCSLQHVLFRAFDDGTWLPEDRGPTHPWNGLRELFQTLAD